ncbi:ubiquitin-like domain-containing protein [Rossellomorea aquimaris]|uniref:G5 and 3D domain-containing protein n=1 Tax=Rossellomorea aquimaris TaxID=189382 RepID=UPI001CD35F5D|nr:G5 and 3D domain-containing protein [Rossellomorea aquimaris]MCA1057249.1 ubiquitin-like domain-containing protein [Rossellomorea aquimaris]
MKFKNMKSLFSKSLSRRKWIAAVATIAASAAVFGILFYEGSKNTVALTLDGEQKEIRTHASTIQDILKDLEISTRSEDYLYPSGSTKVTNNMKVVWEPAKQVEVSVGDKKQKFWTNADTVKELLSENKIEVGEHDKVQPDLTQKITGDMKIAIEKAFALQLVDAGKKQKVWSTSTTVADFLKQQGIKLNKTDRVEPSLDKVVKADDVVNVVRVEKVTDVVEEPTDFTVVSRKDSNLSKGKEEVVQEGKKGLIEKKYEIVKENGKEISRKLISEKTVKESQDKIVNVGTKVLVAQVSRGSSASASASAESGGREFYVSSTAYTASCNGCSGYTATGINLKSNPGIKVIAVDPSVIPLGTKVYVEGYGYAVAADTGSAIKGNKIDVFFSSKSDAYRWGRKTIKVKVLD